MQTVSENYKKIFRTGQYITETSLVIADKDSQLTMAEAENGYRENLIISIRTMRNVFPNGKPEVGGATSGTIDLEIHEPPDDIPRMARLTPYVRLVYTGNNSSIPAHSEWIRKGVFFIDTREATKNNDGLRIITISGLDAMMKAEGNYPSSNLAWPATDLNVVREIASFINVEIDPRTISLMQGQGYQVQAPFAYTMRETLGFIAGMYAGNFIINDLGMLQLISLYELPPESFYLVTEDDEPITFGGDRILWKLVE